jgi:hypothetical protein
MAITGHLIEFSLAEIFQFLEQGHKTGLLTVFEQPEPTTPKNQVHYIWFKQGRIVAAANRSDHHGLISIISHRGWLGDHAASRFAQQCGTKVPLGLYLKSQGILSAEQVKLLFYTQVMRRVCALFTLLDGWFHFDSKVILPMDEMTGLSAPATEVTLAGLRVLKDWSALESKLPDPLSTIVSVFDGKPHLHLNSTEWQIWEYANGNEMLLTIAKQLQLPIRQVQQIVFRLSVVGLIEDVPMVLCPAPTDSEKVDADEGSDAIAAAAESSHKPQDSASAPNQMSHSFLNNLMGFLKHKT